MLSYHALATDTILRRRPLTVLAPTLFPFFRHTIPSVRLAVVEMLHSFMNVQTLPKDWVTIPLLRLLFQNLIVEERTDVRNATTATWKTTMALLQSVQGWMESLVPQAQLLEWFAIMMTPMGVAIDPATLYDPLQIEGGIDNATERHNVDKNMLAQDLTLVTQDVVWRARIASANALACLMSRWGSPVSKVASGTVLLLTRYAQGQLVDDTFQPILLHYIDSASMLQKVLTAIVTEEWARQCDAHGIPQHLVEISSLARDLSDKTLAWLQNDPPTAYHEMAFTLARIHGECSTLLQSFGHECKIPWSNIPTLALEIDPTGMKPGCFSLATAEEAVGDIFKKLKDSLGRTKKRELGVIAEKRKAVVTSIERYKEVKAQHDIRVSAAFAAAFVALKSTPDKVSPIVKGVMNGIKVSPHSHTSASVSLC